MNNLISLLRSWFSRSSSTNVHTPLTVGATEVTHEVDARVAQVFLGNPGSAHLYYRVDSTAVTVGNGMLLPAGSVLNFAMKPGTTLRFIADDAGQSVRIDEVLQ